MGIHAVLHGDVAIDCTVLGSEVGVVALKAMLTCAHGIKRSSHRIDGISTRMMSIPFALRQARRSCDAQHRCE